LPVASEPLSKATPMKASDSKLPQDLPSSQDLPNQSQDLTKTFQDLPEKPSTQISGEKLNDLLRKYTLVLNGPFIFNGYNDFGFLSETSRARLEPTVTFNSHLTSLSDSEIDRKVKDSSFHFNSEISQGLKTSSTPTSLPFLPTPSFPAESNEQSGIEKDSNSKLPAEPQKSGPEVLASFFQQEQSRLVNLLTFSLEYPSIFHWI